MHQREESRFSVHSVSGVAVWVQKRDESGRWKKVGCDACGTQSGDSSDRQLLCCSKHSPLMGFAGSVCLCVMCVHMYVTGFLLWDM